MLKSKAKNPLPHWVHNPPQSLAEKTALVRNQIKWLKFDGPRGRSLKKIWKEVQEEIKTQEEIARAQEPLAFFKPSYEQALMLNSWMYGISFICAYTANRIGKTTVAFINILLWIMPNNPKWKIFTPYVDQFGRKVQVFPRPNITNIRLIRKFALKSSHKPDPSLPTYDPINIKFLQSLQKYFSSLAHLPNPIAPCYPDCPWPKGGTIWFGGPDHDHHEKILFPLWKEYIPPKIMDRYSPSQREITLKIITPPNPNTGRPERITVWELIGKSYESKDTKWSSGAVDIITLTEGITPAILKEIKMRFKDPGIGGHDFTPYEAANEGAASHLAQNIAKGIEKLPIAHHVFTKFSMRMAPDHIMSPELKAERIAAYEGTDEGKARIDGEFYTSSALVLSNLSRPVHLLPYTPEQFRLLLQFYSIQSQLYRGLDPGLDHPTACSWGHLLPTQQWVIYRMLSERRLTISQRATRIIELSHNHPAKITSHIDDEGKPHSYIIETHPNPDSEVIMATVADYHTFKEDETTGQEYSLNYILAGLQIVESIHMGPEERAELFNNDLAPSPYLPTLNPPEFLTTLFHAHNREVCNHCKLPPIFESSHPDHHLIPTSLQGMPGGSKVYFLQYAPQILETFLKWEDMYWQRKKSGDDKGQPKDTIPSHGDDELDATNYLTCSQFRWTSHQATARLEGDSEPEQELLEAARDQPYQRQSSSSSSLQSLQTKDQPMMVFGE